MSRRVLIMIDLQKGFVSKPTEKVVQFVVKLLEKEKFDLVIQFRWENYMGSQYEEQLGYQAVGNSSETEMCFPYATDHIITRTCYSCWGPEMERLVNKDDEIFIVGLETDACVMGTLFSLWDNGYKFKVYEEGVGTPDRDLQKAAIRMIKRQFGKGCVI